MKLLIIDDDQVCNFISTWAAKSTGIFKEIQCVESGKHAVDIFGEVCKGVVAAPDVILVDLNMPVMNGFDVIEYIQGLTFPNKEDVEIVILTSSDNPIDIRRAMSLGIKHYVLKSLCLKELQSKLTSLNKVTTYASGYPGDALALHSASSTLN